MALENQWVTYLQRSYKTIKNAILLRMQTVVPEITDHSESNIFVIIIDSVAGLIEQLNYYIDQIARESFIITARRYSSLVKGTRLIDYRVKAKVGSTVDLRITAVDSSGDPVQLQADETLAAGLIVTDGTVQFITQRKITLFAGSTSALVGSRQRVAVSNENIGTATSSPDQLFQLNDDYQDNTLQITIQALTWERKDTFAFSGPEDRHFIVEVDSDKQAWVVFGDGTNGLIPPNGQTVYATYYTCSGSSGNVEAGTLDTFSSAPTPPVQVPAIDHYEVINDLAAVGGIDEEGIEGIRKHAPLSLRTLLRAVTLQDHKDLCLLVPGVGKSDVEFDNRLKKVIFYVAPEEGGTASSQLLTDTEDFFEDKRMIGSTVEAIAAGETKLRITLTVTVKFRRSTTEAQADIESALQEKFGFNNSDVNKAIRRSDIIALVDNLNKIDYLTLDVLTTKPFPRISEGTNPLEANWYVQVGSTTDEIAEWRIAVVDPSTLGSDDGLARVYRIGPSGVETLEGVVTINQADPGNITMTTNDGTLSLGIYGTFALADEWKFKTYPYNLDHEFEDYTIPIFDINELSLTVNEQVGV